MAITTQPTAAVRRTARGGATRAEPGPSLLTMVRNVMAAPLADYYFVLGSALLLVVFGTMMVLSSSSVVGSVWNGDAYYFAKRQAVFLVVGAASAWWLSKQDLKSLRWMGWAGMGLAVVLLMLTFVPGIGVSEGGNHNWIRLPGGMTLQPSEFAKIAMVVWGADVLHRKQKLLDQPRHLVVPFIPGALLPILLVVVERDLGTAMVMMFIFMAILWVVGTPGRVLAAMMGVGLAGVAVLVITAPNRVARILGFFNPEADHTGLNMQPQQAMYALASGGWWGRGLGRSRAKWGLLQQGHTDYVYAVLGEELGLLGALGVVLLFGVLGFAGFRVAMRSDSLFGKVVAAGITAWFTIQGFINIAVVLRMLPVLGVPLPFVSYGGSALLANLVALGFLLGVARHEPAARRAVARAKGKVPTLSTVVAGRS